MADKITFSKTLNTSVQVGDELWYSNVSSGTPTTPISLGTILEKGNNWVKVDTPIPVGQTNPDLITNGGFAVNFDTNVVTNSTFDGNISGWSSNQGTIGTNFYHATSDPFGDGMDSTDNYTLDGSDRMYLDNAEGWSQASGGIYWNFQSTPLEIGAKYRVQFDYQLDQGVLWCVFYGASAISVGGTGTHTQVIDVTSTQISEGKITFSGINGTPVFGYVDNVIIEKELDAANWYATIGHWDITNGQAEHITLTNGGGYDWLNQDLSTLLVEGETYRITFDVIGGTSGDILLANHVDLPGSPESNVTIAIDSGNGTYTQDWIQGATNTDKIRIYQNDTGDRIIDNVKLHMTSFDFATALGGTTPENLFFMFRKPVEQNVSSLKGYYAESTFTNNSTEKQELFAVGSEVTISSK